MNNNWQPISTAPKDGTPFLGIGFHSMGSYQLVTCYSTAGEWIDTAGAGVPYDPEFWQPLPEPPQ